MFRIGPQSASSDAHERARKKSARRMRRRLWMLMIMLGMVIVAMRQLTQPSTIRRLDQFFWMGEQSVQQTEGSLIFVESEGLPLSAPKIEAVKPMTSSVEDDAAEDSETESVEKNIAAELDGEDAAEDLTAALAMVEDNSPFRNVETEAWLGLFRRLQKTTAQELEAETLGELAYAQLVKQPDVYRGQIVTLRGTVRREEAKELPGNSLGSNSTDIKTYHRLWIEPHGGGTWPFVVHCLELPDGFPRGDKLKAPIRVTGYFFKNRSYAWKEGLGLAPMVLARNIDWQPSVATPVRRRVASQNIITVVFVAAAIAAIVIAVVVHKTRRQKPRIGQDKAVTLPAEDAPVESIREQLGRLSEAESEE